jgi:hypothetical protein
MKEEQDINTGFTDVETQEEEKYHKDRLSHFTEIATFVKSPAGKEIVSNKEKKIINSLNSLFKYIDQEDITFEKLVERVINFRYSLKDYEEFINAENETEKIKEILDVLGGRIKK